MFPVHNCFLFTLTVMKLYTEIPHESRICPIDFIKRSRSSHNAFITENGLFCIHCNCSPLRPIIMTLHTQTPNELRMCPIDFGVKGQGHSALITENGVCFIIAIPELLSSWNFTHRLAMGWGSVLLILVSKGQRSRSQFMDYWKLLMS